MTIRKLDENDLENFRAAYAPGKEHLWPLERAAIVSDLRCLLETHVELNEDVRSFERELTTIARKPDRRQSESRVCFWLRRIGEQLAEEADRAEKMKAERDELHVEVERLKKAAASGAVHEVNALMACERERDEALAQLAALRQCSTCCGTPHASGLPCICGGTNKAEDEVKNLRLESMVLRDAVTRMGEELNTVHAERDEARAEVENLRGWNKRNAERAEEQKRLRDLDIEQTCHEIARADKLRGALYKLVQVASSRSDWKQSTWAFIEECSALAGKQPPIET